MTKMTKEEKAERDAAIEALMALIGKPTTAEEARDLQRRCRSVADKFARKVEELEEQARAEREARARARAMQADFLNTFGAFVLDAVSTDAAALSLFETYGETLRAYESEARARVASLEGADDTERANVLGQAKADLERFSDLLAIYESRKP